MSEFRIVPEPRAVTERAARRAKAMAFIAFCKAHPNQWCEFGEHVHADELAPVLTLAGLAGVEIETTGLSVDMDHRWYHDSVAGRYKF